MKVNSLSLLSFTFVLKFAIPCRYQFIHVFYLFRSSKNVQFLRKNNLCCQSSKYVFAKCNLCSYWRLWWPVGSNIFFFVDYFRLHIAKTCICPEPCESLMYKVSTTHMSYPSKERGKRLRKLLPKTNNMTEAEYKEYKRWSETLFTCTHSLIGLINWLNTNLLCKYVINCLRIFPAHAVLSQ